MINKTRYIPTGFTEYKPDIGDYPKDLFAVYVDMPKLTAIFYTKKQSSHTFFNRFRTVEDMKKKINDTISRLMSYEDKKVERKEERKAPTSLKVGDILCSSWGYDQTNVNFYQVIEAKTAHTVKIREIASKKVSDDGPTTHVVGVKDLFLTPRGEYDKTGEVMTRRVSASNIVHIEGNYCTAWLWDGEPKYETGLGYGH